MKRISEEKLKQMRERAYQNKIKSYNRHIINQKEKNIYYIRNKNLNLIRISNRQKNCLRWSINETKEHIFKKLEICMELKKSGYEFITEAIFHNESRADVFCLDTGEIYEVMCTEKFEDCRTKVEKYPQELYVNYIEVGD